MCEILIRAKDNINPDPELDKMTYKRGYPVCVMPDGHSWGRAEGLPDFIVLKITDLSVEQAQQYIEHKVINAQTANQQIVGRRKFKFDIDASALPQRIKNQIKDGVVTVTKAQILNFIKEN
jgi:hypothetical protein